MVDILLAQHSLIRHLANHGDVIIDAARQHGTGTAIVVPITRGLLTNTNAIAILKRDFVEPFTVRIHFADHLAGHHITRRQHTKR